MGGYFSRTLGTSAAEYLGGETRLVTIPLTILTKGQGAFAALLQHLSITTGGQLDDVSGAGQLCTSTISLCGFCDAMQQPEAHPDRSRISEAMEHNSNGPPACPRSPVASHERHPSPSCARPSTQLLIFNMHLHLYRRPAS
jgi:hypothetical protein